MKYYYLKFISFIDKFRTDRIMYKRLCKLIPIKSPKLIINYNRVETASMTSVSYEYDCIYKKYKVSFYSIRMNGKHYIGTPDVIFHYSKKYNYIFDTEFYRRKIHKRFIHESFRRQDNRLKIAKCEQIIEDMKNNKKLRREQ